VLPALLVLSVAPLHVTSSATARTPRDLLGYIDKIVDIIVDNNKSDSGQGEDSSSEMVEPRIVNGIQVTSGEYNFFVQGKGCGGSLIATDVVLSAGHCKSAFEDRSVIIGNYIWGEVTEGAEQRAIVSDMVVHPGFSGTSWWSTLENDLMLFKIEPSTLPPIEVNSDNNIPTDGQDLTVIGFGAKYQGGPISDTLQKTTLQALAFDTCSRQTNLAGYQMDENSMLCAWVQDASTDSCQGTLVLFVQVLILRCIDLPRCTWFPPKHQS
jgi:secreted trypsin-like serine protease